MVKQKFHSVDIATIIFELQSLVGYRLQNVYDISPKVYLCKFSKPDSKQILLIESGIRFHLTGYSRDKGGLPGSFRIKLRKHLRTKRLHSIRQLGMDRIIDMEFGQGEACYHLISEFYASGNIILTDYQYTIIALLRVVSPDESVRFAVGEPYPFHLAKEYSPFTNDRLLSSIQSAAPKDQVKKALAMRLDFSQPMIEHLMISAGLEANMKISSVKLKDGSVDEQLFQQLFNAFKSGDEMLRQITLKQQKGYIYLLTDAAGESSYQEFHPFLFNHLLKSNGMSIKEFDTFNKAVDEFFSSIETQKAHVKAAATENATMKKLESIRLDHKRQIDGLEAAQVVSQRKAQLIELNLDKVEQAIAIIRSAIATGMDWVALNQLLNEEKIKKNPIALMIDRLSLETNQIVLILSEPDYQAAFGFGAESDDEDGYENVSLRQEKIDIDIGLSAFANARRFYDNKKQSMVKAERTLQASAVALKSVEQKILRKMEESSSAPTIVRARKPLWFEKFNWFISSENYLVVGGKDAQQNEFLVKRHLRKGDVYIHADIPGSSSVIIKNSSTITIEGPSPIPMATLSQAGLMAIVYSKAWDAKVVTSAYWVHHDQVSKTAPSGEYLGTGSFMIRGKKNYLPPTQLVYGYGLLFKVADECIPKHFHERRPMLRDGSLPVSPIVADDSKSLSHDSVTAQVSVSSPVDSTSIAEAYEKYNLDDYGNEEEDISEIRPIPESKQKPSKPHLSAKQRKQNKSGADETSSVVKPSETKPKQQSEASLPRGKRSKHERAKEKYKDQDEEDKEIRMKLLASAGKEEDPKEQNKQHASSLADVKSVVIPKSLIDEVNEEKLKETSDVSDDEEEVQKMLEEENIVEMNQDDLDALTNLDPLTGCPLEDDILLHAIPVCAPYSTLLSYKYKIKLLPGSLKKGKAAKSALSLFLSKPGISNLERDLIRSVPEPEWIQTMMGKVKLFVPTSNDSKSSGSKSGKKPREQE